MERWKLAQAGATPEQIAQVKALQEQATAADAATKAKEQLADADRTLTAATRGSAEAMERVDAYRKMLASAKPPEAPAPVVPPIVPPVIPPAPVTIAPSPEIQQDWDQIIAGVPEIAVSAPVQPADVPQRPGALVGPLPEVPPDYFAGLESPAPAAAPAANTDNLLARVVDQLGRIADSTARDPIDVEVTA